MITFADTGLRVIYPVTPESDHGYTAQDTVSRERYTVGSPGHRWRLTLDLEPVGINGLEADGIIQAHIARHGITEEFETTMPQPLSTNKQTIRTLRTDASADGGVKSIAIEYTAGLPPPIGRLIRFGQAKKIYMVTGVAGSVMSFFPALLTDVANNTTIDYNPKITVRYDDGSPRGVTIRNGVGLATVVLIEAL